MKRLMIVLALALLGGPVHAFTEKARTKFITSFSRDMATANRCENYGISELTFELTGLFSGIDPVDLIEGGKHAVQYHASYRLAASAIDGVIANNGSATACADAGLLFKALGWEGPDNLVPLSGGQITKVEKPKGGKTSDPIESLLNSQKRKN